MTDVWVAAGAAIAAAVLSFIGVFVTVKGNRATSREIASLQNKHAEFLERSRQKHLSSLVAPEKRLEAYQQAYTRWLDLAHAVQTLDGNLIWPEADKCWHWWRENGLYLEPLAKP